MKLTNGSCYTRGDGVAVRVQAESTGEFVCYDADGKVRGKVDADEHVNGWSPIGASQFRETAKPKEVKKKGKDSDKTDKKRS